MAKAKDKAGSGGVYLELFHGRKTPDEELDDWGSNGPVFGPLAYVHTTYGGHIKLGDLETDDVAGDIFMSDGLVHYDGVYYGDWSVFGPDLLDEGSKGRIVTYCERKAKWPKS